MAATKKPTAKQLAARAKFTKMVRAKAAAKKKAAKKVSGFKKGKTSFIEAGEKQPKRGKVIRVTRRVKTQPGTFKKFATISGLKTAVTSKLEADFGKLSVKQALATTKRLKAQLAKEKSKILKQIKKIKSI